MTASDEGSLDLEAIPLGEYGFPGPARDALVAAILDGRKTSTTSLVAQYEREAEPLPAVGDLEAVVDSEGRRVCVTENVGVVVCRLAEASLDHALAEGEGFADVAQWRAGHERFSHSAPFRAAMGDDAFAVDDETLVACVRLRVVRRLDGPASAPRP